MIKTEIKWYSIEEKEPPKDTLLVIIYRDLGTTMFITGVKWKTRFIMEHDGNSETMFPNENVLAWANIDFLDVFK